MSIALTSHKVAAAAVGVAMIFSFAFVTPAQAQTVEELTAQINSLLSTISALQAQLSGMSGGTTTTTGSYNFTLNHKMGDNGGEVMDIQKFLNAHGFTVSATGAGSAGNESSYFGAKTKAAVIAFQNANAASVLAPVGLSAGTGYWGASSRAYANSLGGGTGTGTGTTVPTGTGLTVAAAAQPANGLAVGGAARVPYTKFVVTNNSGSAQTINSVTVERGGLANDAGFAGIVLLDQNGTQIGVSRVLNSNHQASIGEAMTLNPGETRTFTVAANMAASLANYAGEVATLSVVGINTSATVAGSLPITGAAHTTNGTLSIGSVTAARGVEDPTTAATKEIGTTNYTFTAIKLTAGSQEDVRLHSVRFDQSGSASASDLNNVKVYVDGVAYTPTVSNDYYTVNFGSGIVIKEGFSKELVVKGDIIGGTNRTVAFDVYKMTDINVTGETYGYGLTPTAGSNFTSTSPVYDAPVVTISAGSFNSVSKSNAAPAANVAALTSDQLLGAFTVDIKGEPVTVQTLVMTATISGAVGTDVDNVTLVDQNGAVLAGPVDATGASTTGTLTFSSVRFPTGVTTLYVKGYLNSAFGAGDTIVMNANPSGWSDATGDTTGDTVTIPGTTATGNTMTVRAAALTAITSASEPTTRSVVSGATNYIWATAALDAGNSGEDVRVSAVTVSDVSATSTGTDLDNVEIWANLSGGSSNDSVRGDRFETRVKTAEQMTGSTGTNTLAMTLDTHITVAKNSSVEIAVVGSLASSATSGTHKVSISAVTAVGTNSGTTVSVSPTGAGQVQTIASGGTLTTSVDGVSPVASIVLDNTSSEQTVAVFRLASSNVEDLDVDSIKIASGNAAVQKYVFYVGSTKVGEKINSGSPELFLPDGTLTVPANGNVLLTVKAVLNNVDGTTVANGATIAVVLDEVQTTGKGSGTATDDTTDRTAATHTVYEAVPTFAYNNSGVSTSLVPASNTLVGRLTVSNSGDKDITFTTGASDQLVINFTISGSVSATTSAVTLKDDNSGLTLSTGDLATTTGATTATLDTWSNQLTIPAGGSKTLSILVNTTGLSTGGNSIQSWLDDSSASNLEFAIDGTGAYAEGDVVFRGDIYGPSIVRPN